MSVLETKQCLSRLSLREQRDIGLHLLRLRRAGRAWKKATARRICEMQAGKATSIEELEKRFESGK
ncbi:MAG: hypothetical protein IPL39_07360 [Opitutaceae bacterium]|nr:hypothetical protein [Opitutaceae bacterium]